MVEGKSGSRKGLVWALLSLLYARNSGKLICQFVRKCGEVFVLFLYGFRIQPAGRFKKRGKLRQVSGFVMFSH